MLNDGKYKESQKLPVFTLLNSELTTGEYLRKTASTAIFKKPARLYMRNSGSYPVRPSLIKFLAMTKRLRAFAALSILVCLGACGLFSSPPVTTTNAFTMDAGKARLFIYTTYTSRNSRPFLSSRFDARLDGGFLQSFDASEYVTTTVTPGIYKVSVDEYGWEGNTRGSLALEVNAHEGENVFVSIFVEPDHKASIKQIENADGRADVINRIEACNCQHSSRHRQKPRLQMQHL